VPPYVIDIFVANTNNHPISVYQMINDNYNPSTAENTQVMVAVYWDASQDVATVRLMSGSVDISHIMEATSLFSSGYDNSNLCGGNQRSVYFSHLPSYGPDSVSQGAEVCEEVLATKFIHELDKLSEAISMYLNPYGMVMDETFRQLYSKVLSWIAADTGCSEQEIKVPEFLNGAPWLLKAMHVFQSYYTTLRISPSDGQHCLMLYFMTMGHLTVQYHTTPSYSVYVVPCTGGDAGKNTNTSMISLTPIVIYPNKTEGIVPYTTRCHAEACKVDQRQERAIVGEPVHRYIDGLKEVFSAFTVKGLTDIQAEEKLTAVMVVYQNDRQKNKNTVTKQWHNSNNSDGTLDTWWVEL
jgi:hypothetical protein